uniref:SRP9-21 domain-containing protein n=1 Tax=Heterorhabditis bacteriophora TaxID=37862 RepID=A0A1I7XBS4_HETBA
MKEYEAAWAQYYAALGQQPQQTPGGAPGAGAVAPGGRPDAANGGGAEVCFFEAVINIGRQKKTKKTKTYVDSKIANDRLKMQYLVFKNVDLIRTIKTLSIKCLAQKAISPFESLLSSRVTVGGKMVMYEDNGKLDSEKVGRAKRIKAFKGTYGKRVCFSVPTELSSSPPP